MRVVKAEEITKIVANMCIEGNIHLPCDVYNKINEQINIEENEIAKSTLKILIENADYAKEKNLPICQDTGMSVFFVELGQDVHIEGNLTDAINQGVRIGYKEGYLRKSVVSDPIFRNNTNDNTPAIIHYDIVEGDKIRIKFAPKGFGSENMSAIAMLTPSKGREGIIDFVVETVKKAGSNPCPPIVVGIGIGGDFELCARLSKEALLLPLDYKNQDEFYSEMEDELLEKINQIGIGPQGFGGKTTALAVNIKKYPTHIAGMPVAVNISCHVTRHMEKLI